MRQGHADPGRALPGGARAGAAACHPADQPDNTCWPTFAEVTPACGKAFGRVVESPRYQLNEKAFQAEESATLQTSFQNTQRSSTYWKKIQ